MPPAGQPTLSRFENLATPAVLQKLIDFTINTGIERLKQKHARTVIAKAECHAGGTNLRFIVTNLTSGRRDGVLNNLG